VVFGVGWCFVVVVCVLSESLGFGAMIVGSDVCGSVIVGSCSLEVYLGWIGVWFAS